MKTEADIGMMCLQAKECKVLPATPESGRRHGTDSPLEPPREHGHADRNAGLRSQERIDFCCLKLLSLWCFVTTALGNQYRKPRGRRGRDRRGEKLKECLLCLFTTIYLLNDNNIFFTFFLLQTELQ